MRTPSTMEDILTVDNMPTGSSLLKIRRHEMPEKVCIERYWDGMDGPERLAYVPERTCHVFEDGNENYRAYRCDRCLMQAVEWGGYCPSCGARVIDE